MALIQCILWIAICRQPIRVSFGQRRSEVVTEASVPSAPRCGGPNLESVAPALR
jgi:hypothetical protein